MALDYHAFNFGASAELFPARNFKSPSRFRYRRFDRAAEAIRFAVEELPEAQLLGAYIQVDDVRLGHADIRALYQSETFPRAKNGKRRAAA